MATYANVPLLTPTPEVVALVESNFSPIDIHAALWRPHARKVPIGGLVWPWGASRWAEGWFLASQAQLDSIAVRVYANNGYAKQTLTFFDGTRSVSADLWMLTPRPITGAPGGNRLWLLPLVDERYWWWLYTTHEVALAAGTSWAQAATLVASQADISISVDPVPAAYLNAPRRMVAYEDRVPAVLDRIGNAIGMRLVRSLDGTVALKAPAATAAQVRANLTATAGVLAGDAFRLDPFKFPDDLPTALPRKVRLTFPTTIDAAPRRERLGVTVQLSELAMQGLGSRVNERRLEANSSAVATYTGATLTNGAELTALTKQWAHDWYSHRLLGHDVVYAGVYPWTPDGATEIEWSDGFTRARSWHVEGDARGIDLDHANAGGQSSGPLSPHAPPGDHFDNNFTYINATQWWNNYTTYIGGSNSNWYLQTGYSWNVYGPGSVYTYAPLSICGWLFWCFKDYTAGSSQLDDWALPATAVTGEAVVFRFLPSSGFILNGMQFANAGQVVALVNTTGNTITISHENAASTAAYRFDLEGAANLTIADNGIALFWYDYTSARWRCFRQPDASSPTGTLGQSSLIDDYALTTAWSDSGLSVTLPEAGTYQLLCQVTGNYVTANLPLSATGNIQAKLYNSTDAADVPGSLVRVCELADASDAVAISGSATIAVQVTVAASKTINLYGIVNTMENSGSFFKATGDGNTVLSYTKLA